MICLEECTSYIPRTGKASRWTPAQTACWKRENRHSNKASDCPCGTWRHVMSPGDAVARNRAAFSEQRTAQREPQMGQELLWDSAGPASPRQRNGGSQARRSNEPENTWHPFEPVTLTVARITTEPGDPNHHARARSTMDSSYLSDRRSR